ncbi:MAG: tripartite tricarboxylate transporter substrate binding protein [Pseudomonadota bacterium]
MRAMNLVVRLVIVSVLMAIAGSVVAQHAYPSKPIRIVVPFAPGGSISVLARLVGQKMTESWGQQVIVDNRPGGNTIIGADYVAKSLPDGYTILFAGVSQIISSILIPHLPYDVIRDFSAVATIVRTEQLLVAHPSLPARNLKAVIALAKSKPAQLNYGSSGSGSPTHLAGELFNLMADVKIQHIPYKGGGPAIVDILGGQIQLLFAVPVSAISHVQNGRLRGIAVSGERRLTALPAVPTFTEAGLPDFRVGYWNGVLAPAGVPKAILDKLSSEIAKIVVMPDVKEKLASQGMDPFITTPEQLAALMKADMLRYAKIIKDAHIKLD